jgi:hypothetical protein
MTNEERLEEMVRRANTLFIRVFTSKSLDEAREIAGIWNAWANEKWSEYVGEGK